MRIFVAGHKGMVGSALVQSLRKNSNFEVFTQPRSRLDLLDLVAVKSILKKTNLIRYILQLLK